MPITIKPSQFKYKDPSTSQYVSVAAVADTTNLPVASYLATGVVKTNTDFGTNMRDAPNQDTIMIVKADSENIKAATQKWKPIVPYHQHESVFYGLAKAAGDTTQASSSNAVGTYTFGAQTAIQNMLGVPSATDAIFNGTFTLGGRAQGDVGQNSVSFGSANIAASGGSFTLGYGNEVYGASSQAIGAYCKTLGDGATSFGYYTTTENTNAFTIGCFNALDAAQGQWTNGVEYELGDTVYSNGKVYKCTEGSNGGLEWTKVPEKLFVVGNGSGQNDRSNALSVDINGKLFIKDYVYVNADANGLNGTRLPHDIQMNSTSIVSNGIANIPLATTSTPGVSIASGMGIKVNSIGELYLYPASSTLVKAGTNIYVPIMPSNQHESVFYGLAKAAGDSTQSASSNTVGTYTSSALIKIHNMLEIPNANGELIYESTLDSAADDITVNVDSNNYSFKLIKAIVIFEMPALSTGSREMFYTSFKITKPDNTSVTVGAPTMQYVTATAAYAGKLIAVVNQNMPIDVSLVSATTTSNTQNMQSMAKNDIAKYITEVRIRKPDASSPQIPSGSKITVYGIRYYD